VDVGKGPHPLRIPFGGEFYLSYWGDPFQLDILNKDWKVDPLMPAVEQMDEGVEWCEICQDTLPCNEPCEHIWWDEEAGEFSTPQERAREESNAPSLITASEANP
jgi:hypothetical protein